MITEDNVSENINMYVIESDISEVGKLTSEEVMGISQTSCKVLKEVGSEIQWKESFVKGDTVYCVYTAPNEEMMHEHAKKGGFPANSVSK